MLANCFFNEIQHFTFSIFSNIFENTFRRDIGRKSPSFLGEAVLGIVTTWLNLKSSRKHFSLRLLLTNIVRTRTKTTLAILKNFGKMPLGPGAELISFNIIKCAINFIFYNI